MPILHTCILNVSVEVERNISQLVQWGSITRMPKLEASYFVKFSSTLLHPVFAHEAKTLLMKNIIKWFIISVCPNIDDVHLDHLIKVVAVKLLHCQVTLPYLVIETFFCVLKYIYIYIIPLQNLDLLI